MDFLSDALLILPNLCNYKNYDVYIHALVLLYYC